MNGYVAKPLRAPLLLEALARVTADPTGGGAPSADRPPPAEGRDGEPPGPVFDIDGALARVKGDRQLLARMIAAFHGQSSKLAAAIAESVAGRDGRALERAAHKLKGSVGSLGARRAFAQAARLETLGRDGDWAEAPAALARLEEELARLRQALADYAAGVVA
jgi:two-component system, sensor histidine kinase and response regulator